ncbi:hypothetical protein CYMTET_16235 [Cymbomonas tetramitiformis]|uniref:Calcineurin-like phosphoesterase domain-containing protein n=1 Tax=Cymbomonas tetramitiformis TaxID=36881 RepID=A0AAE0GCT3_9CHLO|nr:hypothetical protein CYMTET_16235 [Cymbomonas tetramitiformis]
MGTLGSPDAREVRPKAIDLRGATDDVAVIFFTGSFCPFTTGHLQSLVAAQQVLTGEVQCSPNRPAASGNSAVFKAYSTVIALVFFNSDRHVARKLNPDPIITLADRVHLAALTTEDFPWIHVFESTYGDEGSEFQLLRQFWPYLNFVPYYLNGSDDVVRYEKWHDVGPDYRLITVLRGADPTCLPHASELFLITPPVEDISSSAVRAALRSRDLDTLGKQMEQRALQWCLERKLYLTVEGQGDLLRPRVLTIMHLSDTHSRHDELTEHIQQKFQDLNLVQMDILLHSGDFTKRGTPEEFAQFDEWLGRLKRLFKHIVVIAGNHDWYDQIEKFQQRLSPTLVLEPLKNATMLNHQLIEVEDLKIFGSPWCPFHVGRSSERVPAAAVKSGIYQDIWHSVKQNNHQVGPHRFGEIPRGTDVLMTHGPAEGILDQLEGIAGATWGSSESLARAIQETRPKVHVFGHLHEQYGFWEKTSNGCYAGGCKYIECPTTHPPPPSTYPCQIIACGANDIHSKDKGPPPNRVNPPLVMRASRDGAGEWAFTMFDVKQGEARRACPMEID